ncbi:Flp pilus assembly protein CpaB [Azohydromonas lata]|uniref:Flp pilus assembly protein CpaB n=1 Tax=Azohydromonas lata TaxID=45677 RepID=UPI000834A2F4|nr:Flp pilus assembly protein CpaB [Azohydromonas lata]
MTKRTRGILVLLLALLVGLASVLVAARWMNGRAAVSHRIAVVRADMDTGAKLSAEAVELVDWPRTSVPPGAFTDVKALEGRVTRTALAHGEPVLEARLAPVGTKGGLSAVVGEGKRAMTVRVNDVIGVAGFALPGTYVDIMVNTRSPGARHEDDQDRSISKIVLERILVLAVAQEANRDETKPKVVNAVTLELSPAQAEALDLARSVGTLSLVLRNQVDPQPSSTAGATKGSLLGVQVQPVSTAAPIAAAAPVRRMAAAPAAQPTPAPKQDCVDVIRGVTKTRECF